MSANERSKPDLRVIVHVERHAGYGDGSTLTVNASVCHIDPDQYGDGALSPRFSYQPDGVGEYQGLTVSGQIGSYKGAVDADDFCGLDAIKARQMWRSWNQMHEDERCKRCARSRDLNDRGTP